MADSTISGLAIATSVRTTDRIPFVTLSASSTQAVTPQLLHDYYVLGRGGPAANVNNSTTTTSIYSVGIPANVMGTNRTVRTVLTGEYWHGAGTAATLKIRVGLPPIRGTSAVDTTSASTLDVFVWHSAASAQITYRHWFGHTELV
jgi:hypothetical protein